MIQRALILQGGIEIAAADILLEVPGSLGKSAVPRVQGISATMADTTDFKTEIHEQEHKLILATLQACAFKRKDVAEKLGISDRTLRYKLARMRESGIDIPA